jgi:hypothetical protein
MTRSVQTLTRSFLSQTVFCDHAFISKGLGLLLSYVVIVYDLRQKSEISDVTKISLDFVRSFAILTIQSAVRLRETPPKAGFRVSRGKI